MRKKKHTELRKLVSSVEALPAATRDGVVKFLQLIVSLEEELKDQSVPPEERSEQNVEDLRELRDILQTQLQGGPPVRRRLVLEVFTCAERAFAIGQENSARLLLQVGIVIAAGHELLASFLVQNAACTAALEMVRAKTGVGTMPEIRGS